MRGLIYICEIGLFFKDQWGLNGREGGSVSKSACIIVIIMKRKKKKTLFLFLSTKNF